MFNISDLLQVYSINCNASTAANCSLQQVPPPILLSYLLLWGCLSYPFDLFICGTHIWCSFLSLNCGKCFTLGIYVVKLRIIPWDTDYVIIWAISGEWEHQTPFVRVSRQCNYLMQFLYLSFLCECMLVSFSK